MKHLLNVCCNWVLPKSYEDIAVVPGEQHIIEGHAFKRRAGVENHLYLSGLLWVVDSEKAQIPILLALLCWSSELGMVAV